MSPQQFGRYRISRELGRGAMGVVYLAEDPRLNRQVAIKTVQLTTDDEQEREFLRNRLLRDAQAAAALSHPHIVAVYDVIEEATTAYVVMEYVDGESLAAQLRRVGRPEPTFVLRVLREMAAALDYTHARGVIHRDIKPGNVMIDAAGTAKIMDFGIARIADARTNTPTGMVMGTVHYMAPEQIKGEKLDGRCDQFALAAVAYEMLSGVTMFGAQSLATLAYKLVNEDPPLLRSLNGNLPDAVDAVIRKALAKQPAQRFPTCGDFASALEAAFAGRPAALHIALREAPTRTMAIAGAATAPAAAAGPGAKRGPSWIAIALAGVGFAIGGGVVAVWKPWAPSHPAVPVVQPDKPPAKAADQMPSPDPGGVAPPDSHVGSAQEAAPAADRTKAAKAVETERRPETAVNPSPPAREKPPRQPETPLASASEDEEAGAPPEENAPAPAVAAWKQGNQLESGGDHAGAIAAYTKAIELKPRYGMAYVSRGVSRNREKDFTNAALDCSQAIGILPKNALAYVCRGNARVQLNQMDEALSDFNRAIELNPKVAGAWASRGMLYYRRSAFQQALSDLDEAIRLAPRNSVWYQDRAAVRRASGDLAGARADRGSAKQLRGGRAVAGDRQP